jgi:hypothetical protein
MRDVKAEKMEKWVGPGMGMHQALDAGSVQLGLTAGQGLLFLLVNHPRIGPA